MVAKTFQIATFGTFHADKQTVSADSSKIGKLSHQSELARILQVDRSTICRDVEYLRQQAKENITRYVDERLPREYEKCLAGLNNILKEGMDHIAKRT